MLGLTFFGDTDLAAIAIWGFWIFFAGLVFYLQRENMREGYPLEDETGIAPEKKAGLFGLPRDKTFHMPHGRGELTVPSGQRPDRDDVPLDRSAAWAGAPYLPTGDPMEGGVGPAAWANRRDLPELDGHGENKIRPMSSLPDFRVSAGRDPIGLPVVAGDGEVVGRVKDVWIDVPEQMVRFLTIDLNPEGTGKQRLAPIHMVKVKNNRVVVRSLRSHQFEGIPRPKSPDELTLLEEEKIFAWYAGGTLYHGEPAEDEARGTARRAARARNDQARPDAIVSRPAVAATGSASPRSGADPDRPFPDPADPVRKP